MKTMLFAAVAAVTMGAHAYAPAKCPLMTEWGEKVTPENAWREYPRPQMVRENWTRAERRVGLRGRTHPAAGMEVVRARDDAA